MIVVVLAAVAGAAAIVVVNDASDDFDPFATSTSSEAVGVAPVPATIEHAVQASLSIGVQSRRAVRVDRSGTVTGVLAQVGETLKGGEGVLLIDDAPVVAFRADAPLVRTLSTGDTGPDVVRLQEFLGRFGGIRADGTYGRSTARAVLEFREARSMSREDSIGPADVVWIGVDPFEIVGVEVSVGDHVAQGDTVLIGPPDRIQYAIEAGSLDSVSAWVMEVGGVSVPVSSDLELAESDAATLLQVLGESEGVPAVIHLAVPVEAFEVPASAIWSDRSGTCVFDLDTGQPSSVTVLGTAFGTAQVEPLGGALPGSVVVNPSAVGDVSCGG